MSLVFERFQTEGIAELSYLLGDDEQGVAAVFDPTPDVEKYVELAREKNVAIQVTVNINDPEEASIGPNTGVNHVYNV
jgi:arginine utilization protein RocB